MKIVIDIPDEKFEWIKKNNPNADPNSIVGAVAHGTPLPKGHGRIEVDKEEAENENIPFTSQTCPFCGNSMWGYENGKIVCCVCGHTMADMSEEAENETN